MADARKASYPIRAVAQNQNWYGFSYIETAQSGAPAARRIRSIFPSLLFRVPLQTCPTNCGVTLGRISSAILLRTPRLFASQIIIASFVFVDIPPPPQKANMELLLH